MSPKVKRTPPCPLPRKLVWYLLMANSTVALPEPHSRRFAPSFFATGSFTKTSWSCYFNSEERASIFRSEILLIAGSGVFFEVAEAGPFEGQDVGGFKTYVGGFSGFQRFLPTGGTKAPLVAWLQPGKPVFWVGCREVVSGFFRKSKELFGHDGTNGVYSHIAGPGVATTVAVVTGKRLKAAIKEVGA
jgi:hypothetical protein